MAPQAAAGPSVVARIIHGALVTGVALFAVVVYFVVRPNFRGAPVDGAILWGLLGAAAAAWAAGLTVMRARVPLKSTDEGADLYWSRAATAALVMWSTFEAAGLLGIVAYMVSGTAAGLGVTALAVGTMIAFAPPRLERR